MRNFTLIGPLVLGAVLVGCATAPAPVIQLDHSAPGPRSIAVVAVVEPAIIEVLNMGGAAGAFGLIGGLVQRKYE